MIDDKNTHVGASAAAAPAGDGFRYAAFISYRHAGSDARWARWLQRGMESYRVPKRLARERGLGRGVGRVFRDAEELSAAASLSHEIDAALRESRFLIVVCSTRTPASEWVNREVERFRELGRGDRILALLIEGEPADAFPRALVEIRRAITDASGWTRAHVETAEPLAADVRPASGESSAARARDAKLRLLAQILGVRYDELRQREQERRVSRLTLATAASLAMSAVVGALAAGFFSQSNLAEGRATLAEQRRQDAEQALAAARDQRAVALKLLNGLVIDVQGALRDTPLSPAVRKRILDMAVEGAGRLDQSGGEAGLDTGRTHLAALVHRSEIHQQAGEWGEARLACVAAVDGFRRVAQGARADPAAQRDLAWACLRLGRLGLLDGVDAPATGKVLREAVALFEQLVNKGPSDSGATSSPLELAEARLSLADWSTEQGDKSCIDQYETCLELAGDGAKAHRLCAAVLSRLAAAHMRSSGADDATLRGIRDELRGHLNAIRERGLARQDSYILAEEWATATSRLAELELRLGDPVAAAALATEAASQLSQLHAAAPARVDWAAACATAHCTLSECQRGAGRPAEAAGACERAAAMLRPLAKVGKLTPAQLVLLRSVEAERKIEN